MGDFHRAQLKPFETYSLRANMAVPSKFFLQKKARS